MKRILSISLAITLTAVMLMLVAGCQKQDRNGADGRNGANGSDFTSERQELRLSLEQTRDHIDRRLGELQADIENGVEDQKDGMEDEIDNLKEAKSDIEDRLSKLDNIAADEWETFKAETEQTLQRLESQLREVGHEVEEQTQ